MPIKGATYAVKKTSKGPVRLAFKGGKVVEAKNMKTKKIHTQKEFKADMKKSMKRKRMSSAAMRTGSVRVSLTKSKKKKN